MRDAGRNIGRRLTPHGVHMDHPSVAQTCQRRIDDGGNVIAIRVRAGSKVVSFIYPCGHQRPGFAGDDAVFHHGGGVQQIRDAGCGRAVPFELHHVPGFADAPCQHGEQDKAEDGDPYGKQRHDHRYGLLFTRQGVERGG